MSRRTPLAILIGLTLIGTAHAGQIQEFPGPDNELISPTGSARIINVDVDDRDPAHELRLKRNARDPALLLHVYGRRVSVGWAPDGASVFVNDHEASDGSRIVVFVVEPGLRRIDVTGEFVRRGLEARHVRENHHVYFEALRWVDSSTLLLAVHGYGDRDPNGFKMAFEYQIGKGFRPLTAKDLQR